MLVCVCVCVCVVRAVRVFVCVVRVVRVWCVCLCVWCVCLCVCVCGACGACVLRVVRVFVCMVCVLRVCWERRALTPLTLLDEEADHSFPLLLSHTLPCTVSPSGGWPAFLGGAVPRQLHQLRTVPDKAAPVSYTHLRAHETDQ